MGLSRFRALILVAGLSAGPSLAAETNVAVASNFAKPAEEIAIAFKATTGDDIVLSFGATGALYTQIKEGAPFTVFLAADNKRPVTAVSEGIGVEGSVFTYAIGKLVLYGPAMDLTDGEAVLKGGLFQHIAIADPNTAPYGAAAVEVLAGLGVAEVIAPKIVTGENIAQALQFVESGNAEAGFVALSQVIDKRATQVWRVPADYYTPILQDAVLLRAGEDEAVAKAFIDFLRGNEARAIIEKYGYDVGSQN